jgi:hypothetical protein
MLPFESYFNTPDNFKESTRTASGKVSKIAKRKIAKALDYLLLMANEKQATIPKTGKTMKFKIAFVTLVLPSEQVHTDNEIKDKCLNSFLIELTKYHQVKNYVWRAEKQANGNIHFHLIIDKFVLFSELRKRWNRILSKLGYIEQYRQNQINFHANGFKLRPELLNKWTAENQYKAWKEGIRTNWQSPNTTDIHSVKYIRNLKAYVTKYLTKQPEIPKNNPKEENQKLIVQGRIWSCNQELSDIKGAQNYIDNETASELKKVAELTKCKTYSGDYFTVYYIDSHLLEKYSKDCLFKYFAEYLIKTFNYNPQTNIRMN